MEPFSQPSPPPKLKTRHPLPRRGMRGQGMKGSGVAGVAKIDGSVHPLCTAVWRGSALASCGGNFRWAPGRAPQGPMQNTPGQGRTSQKGPGASLRWGTPSSHSSHTIARQMGTARVPGVRVLVSWIVEQDGACPPTGAFLQRRPWAEMGTHHGGCTVTSLKRGAASGSIAAPEACTG